MGRSLTYQEDELLKLAWEAQIAFPRLSEGAICGKLHVGREYLAERAKDSQEIRALRSKMAAVRQLAWEEIGFQLMTTPSAACSPVAYIWMTRNILGWRNDPDSSDAKTEKPVKTLAYRPDDSPKRGEDSE